MRDWRYKHMISKNEFEPITLERILSHGTMAEAIGRVIANKGGAGVDGMKTGEITEYIQSHPYQISESVRNGTYRPKPIKRVYIPKTMEISVRWAYRR